MVENKLPLPHLPDNTKPETDSTKCQMFVKRCHGCSYEYKADETNLQTCPRCGIDRKHCSNPICSEAKSYGYNMCRFHFTRHKPVIKLAAQMLSPELEKVFFDSFTEADDHPSKTPNILPEINRLRAELLNFISDPEVPLQEKGKELLTFTKILNFHQEREKAEAAIRQMIDTKIQEFKETFAIYFFAIWHLKLKYFLGEENVSIKRFESYLATSKPTYYQLFKEALKEVEEVEKQKKRIIDSAINQAMGDVIEDDIIDAEIIEEGTNEDNNTIS